MENTHNREEELTLRGIVVSEQDRNTIKALSLLMEIDEKEACKLIESLMQSLSEAMDAIKSLWQQLADMGIDLKDICESCTDRRTRHGSSSNTEKPETGKYFIKWAEKYRPP